MDFGGCGEQAVPQFPCSNPVPVWEAAVSITTRSSAGSWAPGRLRILHPTDASSWPRSRGLSGFSSRDCFQTQNFLPLPGARRAQPQPRGTAASNSHHEPLYPPQLACGESIRSPLCASVSPLTGKGEGCLLRAWCVLMAPAPGSALRPVLGLGRAGLWPNSGRQRWPPLHLQQRVREGCRAGAPLLPSSVSGKAPQPHCAVPSPAPTAVCSPA